MSRDSKAEESEEPLEELNETVDANEELDENLLDDDDEEGENEERSWKRRDKENEEE